jgi:capsular exopolysaccharide synthesis family protein
MVARDKQIQELPDRERIYADLDRNVHVLENTYQTLSSKYYAMLINENSTLPNALFAATARPPLAPAYPNKKRNVALFTLLGIVLAIASAAIVERLDKRIRYEDTVSNLTGQLPLAIIPDVRNIGRSNLQLDAASPDSAFVESFRMLRNAIRFSGSTLPLGTLAVTSPGRGEGKSTTAINLAVAMAMNGTKVLIVDCDLRRPSLREGMGVMNNIGFTDLIKGDVTLEEAVFQTRVDNLYCLPAGNLPDNPTEVLDSVESRNLFESLSQYYDVVILDCPPCAGLSDMQVISTIVDGVVLVVSVNQTETPGLHDALRLLNQVNAPIIGSVINRFDISSTGYDSYRHIRDSLEGSKGIRGWLKGKPSSDATNDDGEGV